MMSIIDHGAWERYTPTVLPEGAPANAMFARRASDGEDWYDYVNDGENFGAETVKFAAMWQEPANGYVVGPAVWDPTAMFPAGHLIGEITDYRGTDPQTDFGGKIYDPEAKTLTDPPAPAPVETIEQKVARLVKAELAKITRH
jgi:hypothetical protein